MVGTGTGTGQDDRGTGRDGKFLEAGEGQATGPHVRDSICEGLSSPGRRAYQLGIQRENATNLVGGPDRPFKELGAQLHRVADSADFRAILERRLQVCLPDRMKSAIDDHYRASDADSSETKVSQVARAMVALAHRIIDNAVNAYAELAEKAEAKGQPLTGDDIKLGGVFNHKRAAKPEIRAFTEGSFEFFKQREGLAGELRTILKDSMAFALAVTGETQMFQGAILQLANIKSLNLQFPLNRSQELALARATAEVSPAQLREFLLAVESLERIPLTFSLRTDHQKQRHDRFRTNLALMAARDPQGAAGASQLRTVQFFKDLFGKDGVEFHPFHRDNDALVIDAVKAGIERGRMRLAFPSCPDYSGEVVDDAGRRVYKYTFKTLEDGPGITAQKGFDFVRAWRDTLVDHGVTVVLAHHECTYEVAHGFISKLPGDEGNLTYEQAVAKLRRSGEAVEKLYHQAGIPELRSILTCDVIDDARFAELKAQEAAAIVRRAQTEPEMNTLLETIANGRAILYAEWYPPTPEEGDYKSPAYQARLRAEIIPAQVAEYHLLGQILLGRGSEVEETLLLSYDSPIIWEALAGLPSIHGRGTNTLNYFGA